MREFKIFGNFTEEENYLNEMAEKGYIFTKNTIFGFYYFKKESSRKANYKIDFRSFKTKSDLKNYIALFEDAGWKHICGNKNSGRQYFLPMNNNTTEDIFSDKVSSDKRYKTFYKVSQSLLVTFCMLLIVSVSLGAENFGFQTQNLWNMEGSLFVKAFLFELPFVILRIAPVVVVFLLCIVYAMAGNKAKKMYESVENE